MAIIINPQIKMNKAMTGLKSLLTSLDKIKTSVDDLNTALTATASLAGAAGNAIRQMKSPRRGGSGGSGGVGGGSGPSGRPPIVDPFQNYVNRRQQNNMNRQRYQQMSRPTMMQNIVSTIMRSRITSSGSLMPLVMDLVKVLGPEIAAIAVAFKALASVVSDAVEALDKWTNRLVQGGGTAGQAQSAEMLSKFTGTDITGVGRNLMSGYGPIAAARAGVNPFGGPFGDMDYNKKGLAIADTVHNASSFAQARQIAEQANAPGLAKTYFLDKSTYSRLRQSQSQPENEKAMKSTANLQANIEILTNGFDKLKVALVGPFLDGLSRFVGLISDAMDPLTKLAGLSLGPVFMLVKAVFETIIQQLQNLVTFLKWVEDLLERLHIIQKSDSSEKENVKATKQNTAAIQGLDKSIQGVFGGGPRAQGAIPGKLTPAGNPGYGAVPYGVL
jgi:hypothetical protein